jgi:AcrR family transcriptional regulator
MTALGDYCGRAETDMAESLAGPDEGALDRLRAYLAGLAGRSCPEADLGCMALRFAVELGDGDPEAAARIQRSFDEQRNALLECVRAAQRAGDLDSSVAAEDIACLLMTITRGMEVVAQAGVGATALEGAARQAYAALPLTARAKRREKARAS